MTALLDRPAPVLPPEPTGRRSHTVRLRPALRLAWRDLRRARGRSLLVVLLGPAMLNLYRGLLPTISGLSNN